MSENLPPGFVSAADYIAELRRDPEHAKALDEAREPVLRDIIRALLDRLADRDALAERCEKLRAALATHVVALDDWLNVFAPEHCAEARVKEAHDRIWESGGTLAYIAGLQAVARGALAEKEGK